MLPRSISLTVGLQDVSDLVVEAILDHEVVNDDPASLPR